MSKHKKLHAMYEEYLKEVTKAMDKQDLEEEFVKLAVGVVDLNEPEVYAAVVRTLVSWEEKKKALSQRGETDPEPEPSEELDFTSMTKPKDFDDLLSVLKDYTSSHGLNVEDTLQAATVVRAIRPYMFDTEVPWVGVMFGMLTLAWGENVGKTMLVHFYEGHTQVEFTHKSNKYPIEFTEDGGIDEKTAMGMVYEAYST